MTWFNLKNKLLYEILHVRGITFSNLQYSHNWTKLCDHETPKFVKVPTWVPQKIFPTTNIFPPIQVIMVDNEYLLLRLYSSPK